MANCYRCCIFPTSGITDVDSEAGSGWCGPEPCWRSNISVDTGGLARTPPENDEMSDEKKEGNPYLTPVVTSAKVVWLFLDVLTIMFRLLFNTLVYNSPHGSRDLAGD